MKPNRTSQLLRRASGARLHQSGKVQPFSDVSQPPFPVNAAVQMADEPDVLEVTSSLKDDAHDGEVAIGTNYGRALPKRPRNAHFHANRKALVGRAAGREP